MSNAGTRDASLFIVLEGGDGAGKTTQVALLSAWFDALGLPHVSTREPGGTPVGEAIRQIVLAGPEMDMPAETELMLILGARAAFVRDVVRPALSDGKLVLADRFALSTMAYQGYGRGLDLDHGVAVLARAQASVPPAQRREPRRRGPQRAYVRGRPYEGARDAPRPAGPSSTVRRYVGCRRAAARENTLAQNGTTLAGRRKHRLCSGE